MMEGREQHVIMIVGADGVVPHKVAPEEIPASLLNTRASRRIVVDFVLEGTAVRLKSEQFQLVGYLRSKGFGFVHRKGLI